MSKGTIVDIFELGDLSTPWSLRVAVTLRLAEYLSEGISNIIDLAKKTNSNPRILLLVLRTLVKKGIFEEPEPGNFIMNSNAEVLMDPALRLDFDLNGLGGRMTHIWSTLLKYVQTGESQYQELFGNSFWEDLDTNESIGEEFNELMGPIGHGKPNADIPLSRSWDEVNTVVDIGGGTGSMLVELLLLHPKLHGILVDLPKTVEQAKNLVTENHLLNRITFNAQSFFDPLPKGYDVYILKKVLDDWPDSEAKIILKNCKEALPVNGTLLIFGVLEKLQDANTIQVSSLLCGGYDRTIDEVQSLTNEFGLEFQVKRLKSGKLMLECELKK